VISYAEGWLTFLGMIAAVALVLAAMLAFTKFSAALIDRDTAQTHKRTAEVEYRAATAKLEAALHELAVAKRQAP
jgi:flagellar biogenesis protein FliO